MLIDDWIKHCLRLSAQPADFYSGCRKIIRNVNLEFGHLDDSLTLADAGYTRSKLTMLTKHYLHEESREVARQLWDKRREQARYGSVSFTCFAHFVKGGSIDAKRSKRASVFGPCIQAVSITWLDKKTYSIDVFYRTTELLKKFPADLVLLRDVLLTPFNFEGMELKNVVCHFANVTIHPMYFVTLIPLLVEYEWDECEQELNDIKREDKRFYDWLIKWTGRYVCPEHHRGIAKFAQAQRVKKDALERITGDNLKKLQKYLRDNHPGYRNDYEEDDADDE